ncbi:MAG: HAMP domain-containing histidine kinase, partial [Clostridiales bacterium]|nr:HAMP domain-containing histidine kinase [Clostridiales bacterium]
MSIKTTLLITISALAALAATIIFIAISVAVNFTKGQAQVVLTTQLVGSILNIFLITLIVIVTLMLVALIFLGYLLIRGVLTPLNLLNRLMNEVKNGNLDCPVVYPNKDEFGKVFIAFDEMRLRLKESLEKLAEQEAVRKEMVVSIAHDIKTPVTAISGHAEGLLDGIANTPEKQKKYLITILQKAKAVDGMVNDLFFFSKLDLKQILFHTEKVNVADYYLSVYDELLVGQDDIVFTTDIRTAPGRLVEIDPLQFKRVLQNTFINSLNYRSEEKIALRLELYENNNRVIARIADNGIGASPEECEKLFQRFFRSDRARSSQGSGLGLSISKQIVEATGGL